MTLNKLYFLILENKNSLIFLRWVILAFICIASNGCVTWNLGKIGYLEPSSLSSLPENKFLAGEECTLIMGEPFLEKALNKAKSEKLRNAVIMIETESMTKACYRIYADKIVEKGELKK
jgi:hypothetical protein